MATITKTIQSKSGDTWIITCEISKDDSKHRDSLDLRVTTKPPVRVLTDYHRAKTYDKDSYRNQIFKWLESKVRELIQADYEQRILMFNRHTCLNDLVKIKVRFESNDAEDFNADGRIEVIPTGRALQLVLERFETLPLLKI